MSRPVLAQTGNAYPKIEEDHADDAMKWLDGFTNPMHEANYYEIRQKAFDDFRQMDNRPAMKVLSSSSWIQAGRSQDNHVSGRTSCIAFDKNGTIYLGAISGGLWKSTDNGTNWVSMSETWKTLIVGGVAVDQQHPSVIYCGTGAPLSYVGGGTDISGVGIYKSIDGGLNWYLLPGSPATPISQMEVNRANTDLVYCATTGSANASGGIKMSSDSGHSWKSVLTLNYATSLALDPKNPSIIYAAGPGQVEKSIDSGRTWTQLSGYPTDGGLITLGMSNVSSDTIYMSTGPGGQNGGTSGSVIAISTDAGNSWNTQSTDVNYLGSQAGYANALAVNPTNPSSVVVGGLDIYSSSRGGAGLAKKTEWTTSSGNSNFSHADIHGLKYNPYNNTLYAMTDGGIYYSLNNGGSWSQNMNANLSTMLFIGGDMATNGNGDPDYFTAGAQDNGTNKLSFGSQAYNMILQGDGGTSYISPTNGVTIYGTYTYRTLYRTDAAGSDWANGGGAANILAGTPINSENTYVPFYLEYDVCDQDPNVVAVCSGSSVYANDGTGNLYLSQDGGLSSPNDFPLVTNTGDPKTVVSGIVRTVHIAKNNSSYIFIGTSNSKMYYSTDQGGTWTPSKTSLNGNPLSITSDPNDETHLFMTIAGTTSKHFYISTDTGQTWTAPAKNLPSFNYRRVA